MSKILKIILGLSIFVCTNLSALATSTPIRTHHECEAAEKLIRTYSERLNSSENIISADVNSEKQELNEIENDLSSDSLQACSDDINGLYNFSDYLLNEALTKESEAESELRNIFRSWLAGEFDFHSMKNQCETCITAFEQYVTLKHEYLYQLIHHDDSTDNYSSNN